MLGFMLGFMLGSCQSPWRVCQGESVEQRGQRGQPLFSARNPKARKRGGQKHRFKTGCMTRNDTYSWAWCVAGVWHWHGGDQSLLVLSNTETQIQTGFSRVGITA
eukprot:3236649-Rhodomonas_salina.1